jgi:HEAT repeat protein/protein-S-isoprenylcysteine O-methyltransferase Ste14
MQSHSLLGGMNAKQALLLTLLALVFTIGLTFASIEVPSLLDAYVGEHIDSINVATGLNEQSTWKTEVYLQHYHLRLIGYICLLVIVLLIVAGFVTERTGWTSAGALLLFLPVFGHFAATMFFLGGLGFLRLLWLPAMDVSFSMFQLGDIVNLPYDLWARFSSHLGLTRRIHPSYAFISLGLLIFFLGTLTWFSAKVKKKEMADFGVYRFSRHPQYLGWIIWSYGVMFLPRANIRLCYELSNSLPWLLSTMIIIGVAMLEELRMTRIHRKSYEDYHARTPFLIPLPHFIVKGFLLPLRVMFRKDTIERKREILAVLGAHAALLIIVSAVYAGLIPLPGRADPVHSREVAGFVRVLQGSQSRAERRDAARILGEIGEPALEPLIRLTKEGDAITRAYSADALGNIKSQSVIVPLTKLLHDSDLYVRRTAAAALGRTHSPLAIPPLVEALQDRSRSIAGYAARALGEINHRDVVQPLVRALGDTTVKATAAVAEVLGSIGATEATGPLIACVEKRADCPYDAVGGALWKFNSDRAVDAWIAGVKKGSWWFPRAACVEALGKHRLTRGLPCLHEAADDTSKEVRRAVVLALMEIASDESVEVLRSAVDDDDFEVRLYAREALRRMRAGEP